MGIKRIEKPQLVYVSIDVLNCPEKVHNLLFRGVQWQRNIGQQKLRGYVKRALNAAVNLKLPFCLVTDAKHPGREKQHRYWLSVKVSP